MIGDVIIANLLVSAGLALMIYCLDYNEKEPVWTLVRLYVLSILATFCFSQVKAFIFAQSGWEPPFWAVAFLVAGFCEELLKLILMLAFVWHLKSFDEASDGVVYYLIVAAGFSVMENLGYSFQFVMVPYMQGRQSGEYGRYSDALRQIVLLRMVSGHIFFNVVSGFFLGLAKFSKRRWWIAAGFAASVLLHGFWNEAAFHGWLGWYALGLAVLDAYLIIAIIKKSFFYKLMKRLRQHLQALVQEAKASNIASDVVALMETVLSNIKRLRTLEGSELKSQAREIILTLPVHVPSNSPEGSDELIRRLVQLNGILSRDQSRSGWRFWGAMFLKFFLPGFAVMLLLMALA